MPAETDFITRFLRGRRAAEQEMEETETRTRERELHKLRIETLKNNLNQAKLKQKADEFEDRYKQYGATRQMLLDTPVGQGERSSREAVAAPVPLQPTTGTLGVEQFQPQQGDQRQVPDMLRNLISKRVMLGSGMEEFGIQPRETTAFDEQQAQQQRGASAAAMQPFTIGPGQTRVAGGRPIASVAPLPQPQPAQPRTTTTNEGVMQFNPKTGRYDIRVGSRPAPETGGGDNGSKRLTAQELLLFPTLKAGATWKDAEGLKPGRPMSATQKNTLDRLGAIDNQLAAMEKGFKAEWVGGVLSGGGGTLFGKGKEITGRITPAEQEFRTRTVRTLSEELNRLSGAAISPAEMDRLKNAMPSLQMPAPQFLAAMKISREIIKDLRSKYGTEEAGSGGDPLGLFR